MDYWGRGQFHGPGVDPVLTHVMPSTLSSLPWARSEDGVGQRPNSVPLWALRRCLRECLDAGEEFEVLRFLTAQRRLLECNARIAQDCDGLRAHVEIQTGHIPPAILEAYHGRQNS